MPTGIFRMRSALYHNASDQLAWVQPNTTKHDVVVAVLDTGIDAGHPDLVDNVVGGLSFVGEDPLEDLNGHGTHVAGTISANNNGFGTSGVHPGSRVFALQVFNKLGTGSTSSIVSALNWLASNGRSSKIRVANMSLAGPSSMAVCAAVQLAIEAGITFVVAAGACRSHASTCMCRPGAMGCAAISPLLSLHACFCDPRARWLAGWLVWEAGSAAPAAWLQLLPLHTCPCCCWLQATRAATC